MCVSEHVICDAHNGRITTNKIRVTYTESAKTGQFDLVNQTIRFCQAKPTKPEHPIYKTGTSDFSKLSILIRKHAILIQASINIP
jgi:hypothetical protein